MSPSPRVLIPVLLAAATACAALAVILILSQGPPTAVIGSTTVTGDLADDDDISIADGRLTYKGSGTAEWAYREIHDEYLVDAGDGTYSVRGYNHIRSQTLNLPVGSYDVILNIGGKQHSDGKVTVLGDIVKKYEWEAVVNGMTKPVSFTWTYEYEELVAFWEKKGPRHDAVGERTNRFVVADLDVRALEKALSDTYKKEFSNYGGRQGYADFLLSFVQCCIDHPDRVYEDAPGHYIKDDERGSRDLFTYGETEYWAYPLQTLHLGMGDSEDMAFLLDALYSAARYKSALIFAGESVLPGVFLDTFEDRYTPPEHFEVVSKRLVDDRAHVVYICDTRFDYCVPVGYLEPELAEIIRDTDRIYVVEVLRSIMP